MSKPSSRPAPKSGQVKAARARGTRTKVSAAIRKKEENEGLNRHWRSAFLDHLADTSNVTAAAAEAGVHPSRAYKVRRHEPDFARQWRAALCEGYDNLEMDVLYRLRNGEPKDGPKFDNANALRLLALHRETVARERALRDNVDAAAARASIDEKLEEMRERVLARRAEQGPQAND